MPDFALAWEKAGQLFWEWLRNDDLLAGDDIFIALEVLAPNAAQLRGTI